MSLIMFVIMEEEVDGDRDYRRKKMI